MIKVYNYEKNSFNKNKMPIPKEIKNVNWGRTGDKLASSMHSISSYLAMFAPAMPKYFIEKLTKVGDLIYDPFCGRGTTALKSRELNRNFIGSDLNPYALVLSRSKISVVSKNKLLNLLKKIEKKYYKWIKLDKNINKYKLKKYKELNYFYSPKVLKQLIYLREVYGKKWREFSDKENSLFGITFGLMHGPCKKNGTSIYFSLSMPNALSMSPNYVKNYSIKHNLKKPKINIFSLIKNRINKKYDDLLLKKYNSYIHEIDALKKNHKIKENSVNLLITSPPYLNIVNYTHSNWLKLWLLDYDRQNLNKEIKLLYECKNNEYIDFIFKFLKNVYSKIKKEGHVALVVGDVYGTHIIEEIWEKLKNKVEFQLINIYWDESYLQNKKITNMLNKRKGKATVMEKVLLLRK